MPRLSDSMEEATIVRWLKEPGETVRRGEPLVEVETDKSTIVYDAEEEGVLAEVLVTAGETAALGAPIARLAGANGDGDATAAATGSPITPVARRTAAELGVSLEGIRGTGPGGRISRSDIVAAAGQPDSPRPRAVADGEMSATQRTIARRMTESRSQIPDFTLETEIDMTEALKLRAELNGLLSAGAVSVNDLVVRATALALREYPLLNATFENNRIVRRTEINIGVAVAADGALLVPVIRNADSLSLLEITAAGRAAAERARAHALGPEELLAASFTVSNLGMFGVSSFQAVINPPQAAILAVGSVATRPAFDETGAVVARELMLVSLSCDHRVVYGAEAAIFLARLRERLEHPLGLVVPDVTRGDA